MDVSLFDFELPVGLIALRPARPRDSARMLVVHADGTLEHKHVRDLPTYLNAGDALVVNDTKVIPARLHGRRAPREGQGGDGPKIEILLHRRLAPNRFSAFARPARKLLAGDRLHLGQSLEAEVVARGEAGELEMRFALEGTALDSAIAREGEMPLPPYIAGKRETDAQDADDYQTYFADRAGSVAAPTAGLHFTEELLARLAAKGIAREHVTLHVGAGTFLPVTATDTAAHHMHAEWAELDAGTAERLNTARVKGGRVVAVGTTSLRTLESAAQASGTIAPLSAETDIFITPGYTFRTADILLTNFHLPRSTLFMLVSAFAGLETMKRAYAEAIRERYRFYSYGDACLLFRAKA
ncbi:MAG TPA: tRNA preQ1(34) S-adenosylmethionine ribosyltransferase-isomerase QueA [Rhizomicrobium sp.]|nr:tRNA preQ1(34) S-adenosylmethionine ribosyltransferase-isomerase QueA [Rhizomicrobium sp.]